MDDLVRTLRPTPSMSSGIMPSPWSSRLDGREGLPDFCNNHEAMIEAENFLMKIDELSWDDYYCSFEKGLCSSTTRQRAENYLKVFGEWKE